MNKKILISASILGVLSIVLGAFASHGLKELISEEALSTFETGVKYQMYHAILLLFVGNSLLVREKSKKAICLLLIMSWIILLINFLKMKTDNS